jgi:alpha-glucosidase
METTPKLWWHDAVVYQLYLPSFADSNGDGFGDFGGVRAHLDHLQALGIGAIWLSPCYPSPFFDHGYDVADYFDVNPKYGTLADFDALIADAGSRGIKILMDIVPNHCSWDHAWFKAALAAEPGSPERDRFYFRDGRGPNGELPPNNWRSVFGGMAWTRTSEPNGKPGQWYLQTFTPQQPDLNWSHPDVVQHFDRVLTFWFDRGVEGFRVDAVTVVGKAPGLPDAPPIPVGLADCDEWSHNPYSVFWPSAHDHWKHWRVVINEYQAAHPGRELVTVSEAYTPGRPEELKKYVTDEFHQSFVFELMLTIWRAAELREAIRVNLDVLTSINSIPAWTVNNHDTQRAVTRLGRTNATDPTSFTGNNLVYVDAPVDFALGTKRARAFITMTAALPGTLYIYQGEELGLDEFLDMPDAKREDPIFSRTEGRQIGRDGCRIPLPWTDASSTAFGFSPGGGEPWLPQPSRWASLAQSLQIDDASSMLQLYKDLFNERRALTGELRWVTGITTHDSSAIESLVIFVRNETLITLNPTGHDVAIPQSILGDRKPLFSSGPTLPETQGPATSFVAPDTCVWWR